MAARPRYALGASLAATILAGCGSFGPPDAGVPLDDVRTSGRQLPGTLADTPTGPHVELLTADVDGQEMEIVMQRDGAGACMAVRRPPAASVTCGPLPGDEAMDLGVFGLTTVESPPDTDPMAPTAVMGLVTADVDSVAIEMADGTEAAARMFPLSPAGVEGHGFVAYLPSGADQRSLVARDADGSEVGRLEFTGP